MVAALTLSLFAGAKSSDVPLGFEDLQSFRQILYLLRKFQIALLRSLVLTLDLIQLISCQIND